VLYLTRLRSQTPPRFLRDSHRIDDIAGARPRQHVRGAARSSMDVSDISGASVRLASTSATHNRALDVSDILSDGKRKPQRVTDPLAPVHTIHGMVVKDDALSAPRSRHRETNTPFTALSTHDIEGAVPGWKPKHKMGGVAPEQRRHFRNTNYVGDITGTTAGTRQRGLRSNRVTDPNAPSYTPLEGRAYRAPGAHNAMTRRAGDPSATRQRASDPKDAEIAALRQQVAAMERRARVQDHMRQMGPKPSPAANVQAAAAVASLPDL